MHFQVCLDIISAQLRSCWLEQEILIQAARDKLRSYLWNSSRIEPSIRKSCLRRDQGSLCQSFWVPFIYTIHTRWQMGFHTSGRIFSYTQFRIKDMWEDIHRFYTLWLTDISSDMFCPLQHMFPGRDIKSHCQEEWGFPDITWTKALVTSKSSKIKRAVGIEENVWFMYQRYFHP